MVEDLRPEDVSWKEAQRIRRSRKVEGEVSGGERIFIEKDLDLHFVIVLNPNTPHSVIWFKTDGRKVTKDKVFETFKQIAKTAGDDLLICDGILYQYDRSNGKWLKQRWEDVVFEQE